MDAVLDFLNQPIVLTLVTLTVGSYLLNLVAERRSRRDRLKDQAIEFLTDAGDHINAFVVTIFEKLRTNRIVVDQSIMDAIKELFVRRMSIEVGSRAYLKSELFHQQYFSLLDQYADVMASMAEIENGSSKVEMLPKIRQKQIKFSRSWPLEGEKTTPDSDELVDELIRWMEMISRRVTDLLTKNLNRVIGS